MMINFSNGLTDFCLILSMYDVIFYAHYMCSIAFYQFVPCNGSVLWSLRLTRISVTIKYTGEKNTNADSEKGSKV